MQRRTDVNGTVYLIHFSPAYKHARHYIGWTEGEVTDRVERHESGRGSKLVAVAVAAGCVAVVASTWKGTRKLERELKKKKCSPRLCPLCKASGKQAAKPAPKKLGKKLCQTA